MNNKKAWSILKKMYWSSEGWKFPPVMPSKEDFESATKAGYLFEEKNLNHDEVVAWVLTLTKRISDQQAGNAFLVSLLDERIELRSTLGSYAVLHSMKSHDFMPSSYDDSYCNICNQSQIEEYDLSSENFSRYMWGLTPSDSPGSMAFCLERYLEEGSPAPNENHVHIMMNIIETCYQQPHDATPRRLSDALKGVFKSNKEQRNQLVESLGYCGLLHPPPGEDEFTRNVPTRSNFYGPVAAWRGVDGVDMKAIRRFFPVIAEKIDA